MPFRVDASLHVVHDVHYSVDSQEGPGRLPSGIPGRPARSLKEIGSDLEHLRRHLIDSVPAALHRWAHHGPQTYRRLIKTPAELGCVTRSLGCETKCEDCEGRGRLKCLECRGDGETGCQTCSQTGSEPCGRCNGRGSAYCNSCRGLGTVNESVYDSVWDSSSNQYVQQARQVSRLCLNCSGHGQVSCSSCRGHGSVTCSRCNGTRRARCNVCAGLGSVNCRRCQGSGTLHAIGYATPTVDCSESVRVRTRDTQLFQLLSERIHPESLPQFGKVVSIAHDVEDYRLTSRYNLSIVGARAVIGLRSDVPSAGDQFNFYGLGPELQVVDHCNLVGRLLSGDLAALETELKSTAFLRPPRPELIERTAAFVESELNWLVLDRMAGRSASASRVREEVEQHFKGMVDADYIKRAVVALRRSFSRVHRTAILKPALIFVGIAAILVAAAWLLVDLGKLRGQGAWLTGGAMAIAGLFNWLAVEQSAAAKLESVFGAELGRRVLAELKLSGWRASVRLLAAAVLLALILLLHFGIKHATHYWRKSTLQSHARADHDRRPHASHGSWIGTGFASELHMPFTIAVPPERHLVDEQ